MQNRPNRLLTRCETGWELFKNWENAVDHPDTVPYFKRVKYRRAYLKHVASCETCTKIPEPEALGA
jgi:hypothetical protein